MERISDLFGKKVPPPKKVRHTQRGELLEYFHLNVNAERDGKKFKKLPIGAIAWKLQGLTLADLYYLKSVAEDERRRGGSWGKTFWGSLRNRDN